MNGIHLARVGAVSAVGVTVLSVLTFWGCRGVAPAPAEKEGAALFPPEGIDHLGMKVSVEVEIAGIGKDTVNLEGTVAVQRSGPLGPGGKTMKGDLIAASLRGKSAVFGEVVAMASPIQHSPCEYTCEEPEKYPGYFDLNGWFWLPEHDLLVFSGQPVRVEGVARSIPPVGQKAEMKAKEIPLFSFRQAKGNPVGSLTKARGEVTGLVSIDQHLKAPEATVPGLLGKAK
ncbi:MAG: hypothetical protein HY717_03840 [Planctomycetes bacterium]|nr:hypothetical protein [Planctomycetota bacterium]